MCVILGPMYKKTPQEWFCRCRENIHIFQFSTYDFLYKMFQLDVFCTWKISPRSVYIGEMGSVWQYNCCLYICLHKPCRRLTCTVAIFFTAHTVSWFGTITLRATKRRQSLLHKPQPTAYNPVTNVCIKLSSESYWYTEIDIRQMPSVYALCLMPHK